MKTSSNRAVVNLARVSIGSHTAANKMQPVIRMVALIGVRVFPLSKPNQAGSRPSRVRP